MTVYYILLVKSSPDYEQALLDLAQEHIKNSGPFTGIGNTESFDSATMMIKADVDLPWLESRPWFITEGPNKRVEFVEASSLPAGPLFIAWMEAQAAEADTNADGQIDTTAQRDSWWRTIWNTLRGQ